MPELSEYELSNLIAHLRLSDQLDVMDQLLSVDCANGANFWFTEKDKRGDQDGYSNDVRTALNFAREYLNRADPSTSCMLIGSVTRYSICLATLNEFAETVSSGVLKELVRRNVWKSTAVLDYATRIPSPTRHIESLCSIFPYLDSVNQQKCYLRASEALLRLASLAGNLSSLVHLHRQAVTQMGRAFAACGRHDLVIRICTYCHSLPTELDLVGSVAALLNCLPDSPVDETRHCAETWFTIARTLLEQSSFLDLVNDDDRASCICGSVMALRTGSFNLFEAVAVLERIRSHLNPTHFRSLVEITYMRAIRDNIESRRVKILVGLFPFLDASEREKALKHVLPFIEQAPCADDELQSLLTRLCQTPDLHAEAVLRSVSKIADGYMRSIQMTATFPIQSASQRSLSIGRIAEMASSLKARGDSWSGEQLLLTMSQGSMHLDDSQKSQVLHLVLPMTDHKLRIQALASLLPHISHTDLDDVISRELETVRNVDSTEAIERFCSAAALAASTTLLITMPHLLRNPTNKGWFLVGMSRALDYLRGGSRSEEFLGWVVRAARTAPETTRYHSLISVASYLPTSEFKSAFEVAETLTDQALRLECCSRIARYSGLPDLVYKLRQLVDVELKSLNDPKERGIALTRILNSWPTLPIQFLIDDALNSISRVDSPIRRAELLALVGPWGGSQVQGMRSDLAVKAFGNMKDVVARDVLTEMAPKLEAIDVDTILSYLREGVDNLRAEALPQILERKAALGDHQEGFDIAMEQETEPRAKCLVTLAPYLDADQLTAGIAPVLGIENVYLRDRALTGFIIRASRLGMNGLSNYASLIEDPSQRALAFCAMAKAAARNQGENLVDEALRAFENTNHRMRGSIIESLVETLVTRSRGNDLVFSYLRLIEILGGESREELAPHVYALAPMLHALGGSDAVERALLTFRDVARWWP